MLQWLKLDKSCLKLIFKDAPKIEKGSWHLKSIVYFIYSASVSETVKNTDSAEYGKRTVASNWTKYEMPPSDSEDDENIIGITFTENLDSKRHLLEFSWPI